MAKQSYKTGSVTQKDIAKLAGVSTTVVSYVINNGPRPVNEETRQRVLRAIEESIPLLGSHPSPSARAPQFVAVSE